MSAIAEEMCEKVKSSRKALLTSHANYHQEMMLALHLFLDFLTIRRVVLGLTPEVR